MTQTTATLSPMRLGHVVSASQFDRSHVDAVLDLADSLAHTSDTRLAGRIAATLFYEPSTRTRLSFESAMLRRGGSVIGTESARESSSAVKGESLEDSIRVISAYADVIVLRHPEVGAAERAAAVATVPVINAGDGAGEHPTQALTDLFCIRRERGAIEGAHIALCGDLRNGRTVHSLMRLLSMYPGVRLTLISPPGVTAHAEDVAAARAAGISCTELADFDGVDMSSIDVLYQTRVQKERFSDGREYQAARGVRVDPALMNRLGPKAVVMHPLPRVDEIDVAVDDDPRAAYFRQAAGGVAVRMAVLEMILG